MGLLDQVLGDVLGSQQPQSGVAAQQQAGLGAQPQAGFGAGLGGGIGGVLMQLLSGQARGAGPGGGLAGLIDGFRSAGLGHLADSWIGSGQNLPVSPDQLRNVLGQQQTEQMARQSGIPIETLLSQLAQHLPGVVDRLTPNGTLPAHSDLIET